MIQRPRLAFNASGSMLLQTLVGLGILSILTIAMIGFFQFSTKSQRRLRAVQAFNDQLSMAQMSLDDVKACTYNFGTTAGGPDGMTLAPVGSDITVDIKRYDADHPTLARASAPSVFKNGSNEDLDNTLSVMEVKLKTMAKVATNHFIGQVLVRANRTGGATVDEIDQSFPVYMVTDGSNKVLYCYGNFASGGLMDLQQKQCEVLLGADYFWNPATNGCDYRFETKCFAGGQTSASCDPVTTFGLGGNSCQASGYVDNTVPPPPVTRTYASGNVGAAHLPGPYECHTVDAYNVNCDFATDVDISGAICSACCKVEKPAVQQASQNIL